MTSSAATAWTMRFHRTFKRACIEINPPDDLGVGLADRAGGRVRLRAPRIVVGQLDVAGAAMKRRASVVLCLGILLCVAPVSRVVEGHVGSADTFFSGKAGVYDVRVSVRLPGVIPGRAQVAIRVVGAKAANDHRVSVQAGQWNVGLKGAPPPERAAAVPGDPELYSPPSCGS